jgi:hypothetical protein
MIFPFEDCLEEQLCIHIKRYMMAVRPTWADLKISRACLISDIILIYFRKAGEAQLPSCWKESQVSKRG